MLKSMPFHIAQHGESVGQFSREEVLARLQARAFQPHDHCWQYGMEGWQTLEKVFAQQIPPPPLPTSEAAPAMPQRTARSFSSGPIFAPSEPFLMSDADDLPAKEPEAVWPQAAPVRKAELKTLQEPVFPPSEPFLDEEATEFKQVVFPASAPITAPTQAEKKPAFLKAKVTPVSKPEATVQAAVAEKPTPVFPPAKELPAAAFPPAKELPISVFPPAKELPARLPPVFSDTAPEEVEVTPTVTAIAAPEAPVFKRVPPPALPEKKSAPPPLPVQQAPAIRPPIPQKRPPLPPAEPRVPLGTSLGIIVFVIALLAVGWYLYQSVH